MDCRACGHENPAESRFCLECGAVFELACRHCGAALPGGARFCNQCGGAQQGAVESHEAAPEVARYTPKHLAERILRSRSALEGERKQVTVLFADVRHSMELAEALDPEDWHRILDGFFQILSEGVHRFDGTVNQYTGDGIMALFGAPLAHEDHAQWACYAALWLREPLRAYADELRRERGLSFSLRIGMNSGDVVVGRIGDDLRMDYTAQGHTVGLAQRIEQLAEPGSAYLTEYTARLVEGYVALRDLGQFTLKGVAEPVGVLELEGAGSLRTRLDISRERGFSHFVGRAREMAQLESALASTIEGRGQILGVVGEAGVGKSQLCFEFLEGCRARGIPVWEAHCPPHGRAIPMLPILELNRNFFGIGEHDDPADARRRVAGTLVLLDESLRDELGLMFDMLRIPDPERPPPPLEPAARHRRLLANTRRLLEARSERQAAVILVDDLHWIDPQSDAFLAELVDAVATTRTLLLANFRPEYDAPWMNRSDYQRIPIVPLGAAETDLLLRDLLGADPSLAGLRARLCERAGGNPFFAEELVRALVESGALGGERGARRLVSDPEELSLPGSVQGVLAARIDRLPEPEERVLQAAAVIGREFSEPVLERVVDTPSAELPGRLTALRAAELIHQSALYPVAEYAFRHPLTHQVALDSQLAERRARTHAAVARAIEEIDAQRLDERAPLLAHHCEQAGEHREAVRWHRRAAAWASIRDPAASLAHWRRLRELGSREADDEEMVALRGEACREILFTSWRAGLPEEEWRSVYDEGEALARRSGDVLGLSMLKSGIAGLRGFGGEHRAQVELLLEALELAQESGDFALEASLHQRIGSAWQLAGDNHKALEWTERGIAFCRTAPEPAGRVSGFDTYAWQVTQRGWILTQMGRLDEAERAILEGMELARAAEDEFVIGYADGGRGELAWIRGDRDASRNALPGLAERAASSQNLMAEWVMRFSLAFALAELGDNAAAFAEFERALAIPKELGGAAILSNYVTVRLGLARVAAVCGDLERAHASREEARRLLRETPELGDSWANLWLEQARADLALEGANARREIEAALERVLEAARERGWGAFEPFALWERAKLARLIDDGAATERDLREAKRLFESLGAPLRAAEIAGELERDAATP